MSDNMFDMDWDFSNMNLDMSEWKEFIDTFKENIEEVADAVVNKETYGYSFKDDDENINIHLASISKKELIEYIGIPEHEATSVSLRSKIQSPGIPDVIYVVHEDFDSIDNPKDIILFTIWRDLAHILLDHGSDQYTNIANLREASYFAQVALDWDNEKCISIWKKFLVNQIKNCLNEEEHEP